MIFVGCLTDIFSLIWYLWLVRLPVTQYLKKFTCHDSDTVLPSASEKDKNEDSTVRKTSTSSSSSSESSAPSVIPTQDQGYIWFRLAIKVHLVCFFFKL